MSDKTLLKIGEFSRLSQVTVKTLHHYDDIGLLKPSQIDRFTSYRYYTLDQLPRIHSIMALKELGLSLEEITHLMCEDLPPDQIRGMYRLKLAEAQRRVREEQARMTQIEFRLRQIELEGRMQTLDIVLKRIEPFYALTFRHNFQTRVEREVVGKAIEKAIQQGLMQVISTTPPVNIFYEDEFRGEYRDTEGVVPVEATHTPTVSIGEGGRFTFKLRQLPPIELAATYLHQGDYDTLNEKYLFVQRWAVENGYKLSGTWRFIYHRGPMHHVDPSQYLTEIQNPIESAV